MGIAERPISHKETPIVIDIDFKYILKKEDEKLELSKLRKHTCEDIRKILVEYKKIYLKYFDISSECSKNECNFVVMQRDNPYISTYKDQKIVKDGIHIINPGFVTFPEIHLKIRKEILQNKNINNVIKRLGTMNKIDDIIDEAVICKNCWLMYGSSKPSKEPYKVFYIFDYLINEIDVNDFEKKITSFSRYLSYWRKSTYCGSINEYGYNTLFENNIEEEKEEDEDVKVLEHKKEKKTKYKKSSVEVVEADNPNQLDNNLLNKIKILTNMLSKKRRKTKSLWKEVGRCLYNLDIDKKVDKKELLNVWFDFSKKYHNCSEERTSVVNDCKNEWDKMIDDEYLSISSLKFWASKDNPHKYNKFVKTEIYTFLLKCTNTTHVDITKTLHLLCGVNYVCSSIKDNIWYEFKDHRWQKIQSGYSLRNKIKKELAIIYTFSRFLS